MMDDELRTFIDEQLSKNTTIRRIALCEWGCPAEWIEGPEPGPPLSEEGMGTDAVADSLRRILTTEVNVPIFLPDGVVVARTIRPGTSIIAVVNPYTSVGLASVVISRIVKRLSASSGAAP